MRYLLLLLLVALLVTPARADDYWIGNYAYTIPGADVRSSIYCRSDARVAIYRLTATDTLERRYWLMIEEDDLPNISIAHTGLVRIEGVDMVWIRHKVGDEVIVTVSGDPCWPRDEDPLEPRYRAYLPLLIK